MTINFNRDLANKIQSGMQTGDAIELPFPVVYLWVINGQANFKSQGGALYYGGWACKAQELNDVADAQGLTIPADWKHVTQASKNGEEFDTYTTRHVFVTPFGRRESWLFDGKRHAHYVEGGRRHLQLLAFLAVYANNAFSAWGPVVLSAKGYQARNLNDALKDWKKATAEARQKLAPGIPENYFYMTLGTFGENRMVLNVGKPGAQSPITPISVKLPEEGFTPDQLEALYIGDQVEAIMADLTEQAQEWLGAWKKTQPENGGFDEEYLEEEERLPF